MQVRTKHSHLFRGAQLAFDGAEQSGMALVEFGDGTLVVAASQMVSSNYVRLSIPAYRTARGTFIQAADWLIESDGSAWKVARKASPSA